MCNEFNKINSVGNEDMFYIKHESQNFTMIDCNMDESKQEEIVKEIKKESSDKSIVCFISTHPDNDCVMA